MRTVQQVFDAMISYGYYNPYLRQHYLGRSEYIPWHTDNHCQSHYMCVSIQCAMENGFITRKEYEMTFIEIDNYLSSGKIRGVRGTMHAFFETRGIPNDPIDMINLYRYWESRPSLNKVYA